MAPSAARARWAGGGGPAAARVLRVAREEAPGAGAGAGAGAGGRSGSGGTRRHAGGRPSGACGTS